MSAFQCIQPHARTQEARGSGPQPSQPGGPSGPYPQPSQPGGPSRPYSQPSQPGDQAQRPLRAAQPDGRAQRPARPGQPDDQAQKLSPPGPPGDPIGGFFDVFARASSALDLDALAGCFDETFLSSDASGTRVVPRPAFLQALAGRVQMFAKAGIGPAALRQLTHQELDPHHVLARTTWAAPRTDGSGEVALASSFLLRRDGDLLRIVVYINHKGPPS